MNSRQIWAADPNAYRDDELAVRRSNSNQLEYSRSEAQIQMPRQTPANSASSSNLVQRRRLVFADPVAFRYLEEDASTVVLERRGRLKGYELYLVEQWACSRVHPTFVIATYTGDETHSVLVGVLGVPIKEDSWSPRLRIYLKAISQYYARPKETPFGMLMVTNLSSFPSALTVIPVPDGDIRKHREDFIVNEDLKRLGCSGRSGLSLTAPAGATQAKFHQLYKTSDRVPIYSAVIELVKICQVSLLIFGKLEQEYADGLLCDVTEKAINNWWTEVGSEYYNLEPSDGVLGPMTVAALLGLLMGARNRLNYYGAPVTKDAFDIPSLKRGIAYFQKSQKLDRTRRLDRETLERLHRVTAKGATGEGWAVPKAVKSTVVELSGKGGDMVMGMVGGGRDKAAIGDIETLDIDRFVRLVHGERCKWLWYGKLKRNGMGENFGKSLPDMGSRIFSKDDQGGYVWTSKRSESLSVAEDEPEWRHRDNGHGARSSRPPAVTLNIPETPIDRDPNLRKTVFKSVTGKMSDARSGFGRIKDAVGLRGHASRHSKDDNTDVDGQSGGFLCPNSTLESGLVLSNSPDSVAKTFSWKNKVEEYENGYRKPRVPVSAVPSTSDLRESESPQSDFRSSISHQASSVHSRNATREPEMESKWSAQVKDIRQDLNANDPYVTGSVHGEIDPEGPFVPSERDPKNSNALLYRRHSIPGSTSEVNRVRNTNWWPRHMSFSVVEEVVLSWDNIGQIVDCDETADNRALMQTQMSLAEDLKRLFSHVSRLEQDLGRWVEAKVKCVDDIDVQASRDQEELQTLYYQLNQAYESVKQSSEGLLSEERSHMTEAIKDIEALGAKVEYEIEALVSKVEDVEDGVRQFEGLVDDVEAKATELKIQLKAESWLHWAIRTITGIGTGPVMD